MQKRWKKIHLFLVLFLLSILVLLTGCGQKDAAGRLQMVTQVNGKNYTIAVETGTITEEQAKKTLPDADYLFVNSAADGYLAVESGKVDAYAGDRAIFESAQRSGLTGLSMLGGPIGETGNVAAGISPLSDLPDAQGLINAFLQEIKSDGTLDDMVNRWYIKNDYTMPAIEAPDYPSMTIRVGTTGLLEPCTFYQGAELTGFEIELMKRFALWADAELEIFTYDWAGLIPACAGGKVDYVMSDLFETEERRESIGFSDPYINVETVLIVKESDLAGITAENDQGPLKDFDLTSLKGAKMGAQVGSIYDKVIQEVIEEPEILYYDSRSDLVQALKSGKIMGYLADRPTAVMACRENPDITYWDHIINEDSYGYAFPKTTEGEALCAQMSELLVRLRGDGTLDRLEDKWLGDDEAAKTVPDTGRCLPQTERCAMAPSRVRFLLSMSRTEN